MSSETDGDIILFLMLLFVYNKHASLTELNEGGRGSRYFSLVYDILSSIQLWLVFMLSPEFSTSIFHNTSGIGNFQFFVDN